MEVRCYEPFLAGLGGGGWQGGGDGVFTAGGDLREVADVLFCIGGDGTFLDSVPLVRDSGVPVLGINGGRLGFLATTAGDELEGVVAAVCEGRFEVECRALVRLLVDGRPLGNFSYAMNEVSVLKTEDSSLLTIHAYIEGEYLTRYWADGLLVATPTGSTAYSLSCGGPIVVPACDNLILTPVSPHNLTMRPLVLPGGSGVQLKVETRSWEFVLGMDSTMQKLTDNRELFVSSGDFKMNVVKLPGHSFYGTLREKLMWGEDARNGR